MTTQTEKTALTQRRCFKDDAAEILRLGKILETPESGRMNSEHVIRHALTALGEKLGSARPIDA